MTRKSQAPNPGQSARSYKFSPQHNRHRKRAVKSSLPRFVRRAIARKVDPVERKKIVKAIKVAVKRLAIFDSANYAAVRKQEAKDLGIGVGELDQFVAKKRTELYSKTQTKSSRDAKYSGPAYTLNDIHEACRYWFGDHYDLDLMDAVLATLAVEKLPGTVVWLMLMAGSGDVKTTTVTAADLVPGVLVRSTINSEGALLSGIAEAEWATDATGGLLYEFGERGTLVLKDFTSILSMERSRRSAVLAALREVHDGEWSRTIGSAGAKSICWKGRLAVIAACTTAWDAYYSVIATMGDRFVVFRANEDAERLEDAGRRAISASSEDTKLMHTDLAEKVAGLIANIDVDGDYELTFDEEHRLLQAAIVTTWARTPVQYSEFDGASFAHAREAPTRFGQEIAQIMRGGLAIGKGREDALRLALRGARDSIPPPRLAVLQQLAKHPGSTETDIVHETGRTKHAVGSAVKDLAMLGIIVPSDRGEDDAPASKPFKLADRIDPAVLA